MCAGGQGTTRLPPLLGHDPIVCVPLVGFGLSHRENLSLFLPIGPISCIFETTKQIMISHQYIKNPHLFETWQCNVRAFSAVLRTPVLCSPIYGIFSLRSEEDSYFLFIFYLVGRLL